jgi:hypothetical protein
MACSAWCQNPSRAVQEGLTYAVLMKLQFFGAYCENGNKFALIKHVHICVINPNNGVHTHALLTGHENFWGHAPKKNP